MIKLKISNVLADESALKSVFGCKGASGIRTCILCQNVVSISSNLVEGQHYLVDLSCSDPTLFHPATDESVWALYDNLAHQRAHLGKGAYEQLEKASGFTYDENSLMADHELRVFVRPISVYTMDWMHNFLCNGVCSVEIAACLGQCHSELGLTYAQLDSFVRSNWSWPSSQSVHKIDAVFSHSRDMGSAETFRGSASDLLMVFPILRHFTEKVVIRVWDDIQWFCIV